MHIDKSYNSNLNNGNFKHNNMNKSTSSSVQIMEHTDSPNNPEFYKTYSGIKFGKNNYSDIENDNIGFIKLNNLHAQPLPENKKADFYSALETLEDPDGDFMNTDLTKEGLKLDLSYPRKEFVKDIDENLSTLTEENKEQVTDYFGFELQTADDGSKKMNGYPIDNDDTEKFAQMNHKSQSVAKSIRPLIKMFNNENKILQNEDITPNLANNLNKVTTAFPEFNTVIGKPQHKTHSYTVDIHTLNVLQNVMKNPEYKTLPKQDRRALQTAVIFHDLTKIENSIDKSHPAYSSHDAYHITKKLDMPEKQHYQVYKLIRNHDWLERYNPETEDFYANELKDGNNFKMECILTEADLKSVKRDGSFYTRYGGSLINAEPKMNKKIHNLNS